VLEDGGCYSVDGDPSNDAIGIGAVTTALVVGVGRRRA
jgi:hypothetical protein